MFTQTNPEEHQPRTIKRTWVELQCPDGRTRVTMPLYPAMRVDAYARQFEQVREFHKTFHQCNCVTAYISVEHEYE